MSARASGLDTVFIRVIGAAGSSPDQRPLATSSGDDVGPVPYLALIYSQLPLPVTPLGYAPAGQPTEWSGDPLIGAETFSVHWGNYARYLASYLEGEKGAS